MMYLLPLNGTGRELFPQLVEIRVSLIMLMKFICLCHTSGSLIVLRISYGGITAPPEEIHLPNSYSWRFDWIEAYLRMA